MYREVKIFVKKVYPVILLLLFLSLLPCSERTEPVSIYILVDKSLSMEESGAFKSAKDWLTNSFIQDHIIKGDSVSLYFFYGETTKAFSRSLTSESDFNELKATISNTAADGAFTDIGLALDTVKQEISNTPQNRKIIALLLTDLIQEASYGSKYAGTYYDFAQRYMTEDKIISHTEQSTNNIWYEITIQIENLKTIEERSEKIYNIIKNSTTEPLYVVQNRNL